MAAPTEFRVKLIRTDDNSSSLAPEFTVIIIADDISDAKEKAEDLARTLEGFRVEGVEQGGDQTNISG